MVDKTQGEATTVRCYNRAHDWDHWILSQRIRACGAVRPLEQRQHVGGSAKLQRRRSGCGQAAATKAARRHQRRRAATPQRVLVRSAAYTFHVLRDRDSADDRSSRCARSEHLGGFILSYERELIPEHLALTIAKPFYFSRERFDTPFDVILRGIFRRGAWKGFIGAVVTWNIRVFEEERAEQEGEKNLMSFGVSVRSSEGRTTSRSVGAWI